MFQLLGQMKAEGFSRERAHRSKVWRPGPDRERRAERLRGQAKQCDGEDGSGAHRVDSCGETARLMRRPGLG